MQLPVVESVLDFILMLWWKHCSPKHNGWVYKVDWRLWKGFSSFGNAGAATQRAILTSAVWKGRFADVQAQRRKVELSPSDPYTKCPRASKGCPYWDSTVCLQKCIQEPLIKSVLEQHCAQTHHNTGNMIREVSLPGDCLTQAGSRVPFLTHKRIQGKYIKAIFFLLWKLLLHVIAGTLLKNGWEPHSAVLQLTCLAHTVSCSCQSWSLPEDDGFRWCPTLKDPWKTTKKGRDVIKEVEINTENPHFRSQRYWKPWQAVLENIRLVFLDACAVWLILMASFSSFCMQYRTYLALTTTWLRLCQHLLASCGTERSVHPWAACWHTVMAFCVCFLTV